MLNPAETRRMFDGDAALRIHLFEVAVADPVLAMLADADQNNVGR